MKINTLLKSAIVASCVFVSTSILADDSTILSVSIQNSTHKTMTLVKYEDSGIWKLLGDPWYTIEPTNKAPYALGYSDSDAKKIGPLGSADIVYNIPCPDGTNDQLVIHASGETKMIKQINYFTEVDKKIVNIDGSNNTGPAHCSAFKNPVDSVRDRIVEIEIIPAGSDPVK